MSDIKAKYGTGAQAIAIGLDGLAASATVGRSSTAVDNQTNLFVDALVQGKLKTAAGTPAQSLAVYVYVYGTADAATPVYSDGISGTSGSFTRTDPPNLKLLTIVHIPAGNTEYSWGPVSVAKAFGGILPAKWGIAMFNDTNLAMAGTATQDTVNPVWYQGVLMQTV